MNKELDQFNTRSKLVKKLFLPIVLAFVLSLFMFIFLDAVLSGLIFLTISALFLFLLVFLEMRLNQRFRREFIKPTVKAYFSNFLDNAFDEGYYACDRETIDSKGLTIDDFLDAEMLEDDIIKVKAYDCLDGTLSRTPFKSSDIKVRAKRTHYVGKSKNSTTSTVYAGRLIKLSLPNSFKGRAKLYTQSPSYIPQKIPTHLKDTGQVSKLGNSNNLHIYPLKSKDSFVNFSAYATDKDFAETLFSAETLALIEALVTEKNINLFLSAKNNTLYLAVSGNTLESFQNKHVTFQLPLLTPIDESLIEHTKDTTKQLARLIESIKNTTDLYQ